MSEQVPSGYVWNCFTKSRDGDGPLFVAHDDTVTARLDGYAVIPMEEHNALEARIATLEATLREAIDYGYDRGKAVAALWDAPDNNERAERIAYCIARGIDPFEIVADGGCEAWMAVTEHNLRSAAAALADAPGERP